MTFNSVIRMYDSLCSFVITKWCNLYMNWSFHHSVNNWLFNQVLIGVYVSMKTKKYIALVNVFFQAIERRAVLVQWKTNFAVKSGQCCAKGSVDFSTKRALQTNKTESFVFCQKYTVLFTERKGLLIIFIIIRVDCFYNFWFSFKSWTMNKKSGSTNNLAIMNFFIFAFLLFRRFESIVSIASDSTNIVLMKCS